MAILRIPREKLLDALSEFDASTRALPEWADWASKGFQLWALDYEGKTYPPKKIISMATGMAVNTFSGGSESNDYLNNHGISKKANKFVGSSVYFDVLGRRGVEGVKCILRKPLESAVWISRPGRNIMPCVFNRD